MIEQIKQAYTFIKKWFWALPMWKRTILTSIIGAFAGSSVIGFLNKYALYYHAFKQGFRIPVEGVEYLDLAISLISFSIILTSIIGTIIIYFCINLISDLTLKLLGIKDRIPPLFFNGIKAILSITFAVFTSFVVKQNISIGSPEDFEKVEIIYGIISLIMLFFMLYYDVKKKKNNKILTLFFVALLIVILSSSLFNQKLYSNFLATIHYGGRISVVIEYRKADNTAASATGELLIRTSHSVTILNTDTCAHEEIPAERVSKIGFIKE